MANNDNFNPNSVNAVLARMESKIDRVLEVQREHSKRISILEQFRYWIMGIAVAVGLGFELLSSYFKGK